MSFDLPAITLGEVVVSTKGGKSVPILSDGQPLVWTPELQQVAYEPTAFNGEEVSRVNLVMRVTPGAKEDLAALDVRLLNLAVQNSQKIFGKQLSEAEVMARWSPLVKVSEKGYAPTFKCKINLSGKNAVRCWTEDKELRPMPLEWVQCSVQPRILVKGLWVMSKEIGVLLEASDVLVQEAERSCPF